MSRPNIVVPEGTLPWRDTDRFVPRRVVRPLQRLMQVESSSAALILVATIAAVILANTGGFPAYTEFWETPLSFAVAGKELLHLTLHEVVNDGLMTLFFLLVSLEIKRELVFGELRDPRAAALPVIAAVGGMAVPALIFTALNAGGPHQHGWGIPMATDIAFALAVVTALGSRVPVGARLFLLTLAIVDDLGAILVIAAFYTADLDLAWLALTGFVLVVAMLLRRARVRALGVYLGLGALGWLTLHQSGVHATLIGVAFGLLTPAYALLPPGRYPEVATRLVEEVSRGTVDGTVDAHEHEANDHTLREIRRLSLETRSPLHRAETRLAPYVAFGIVPVFAFANAGIPFPLVPMAEWIVDPVVTGIVLGLVVGKTTGIFGAAWLAVKVGLARFPPGMRLSHLFGVSLTGGIGFTVAIFVATLAFDDRVVTELAKLGIMLASVVAAVLGYLTLRLLGDGPGADQPPARRHRVDADVVTAAAAR